MAEFELGRRHLDCLCDGTEMCILLLVVLVVVQNFGLVRSTSQCQPG